MATSSGHSGGEEVDGEMVRVELFGESALAQKANHMGRNVHDFDLT